MFQIAVLPASLSNTRPSLPGRSNLSLLCSYCSAYLWGTVACLIAQPIAQWLLVQSRCSLYICWRDSIILEPVGRPVGKWVAQATQLVRSLAGPRSRTFWAHSGAAFMLHMGLACSLALLCDGTTTGGDDRDAEVAHSCGDGLALCCRPGRIHELPSLLPDSGLCVPLGSHVRQLHPILYPPHLSWFPLAISGCVGARGLWQLLVSNAHTGGSLLCYFLRTSGSSSSLLTLLPSWGQGAAGDTGHKASSCVKSCHSVAPELSAGIQTRN